MAPLHPATGSRPAAPPRPPAAVTPGGRHDLACDGHGRPEWIPARWRRSHRTPGCATTPIKRMLPAGISDVLEVGCGQGALGVRLAQRYQLPGRRARPGVLGRSQRRISAAGRGEVRNVPVEDARRRAVRPGLRLRGARAHRGRRGRGARSGRPGCGRADGCCCPSRRTSTGTVRPTSWSATSAATIPAAMTALLASCGFTEIRYASTASRSATCWRRPQPDRPPAARRGGSHVGGRAHRRVRPAAPAVRRPARGCRHPLGDRAVPGAAAGVPEYRNRPLVLARLDGRQSQP